MGTMSIQKQELGQIDGQPVWAYEMHNGSITVSLMTYGGGIRGIYLHESQTYQSPMPITLTLDKLTDYRKNPLFAGATLGPNSGRISDGRLIIENTHYQLSQNDQKHQLHGGECCLSFCHWTLVRQQVRDQLCQVVFSCFLADGVDGYPGNRQFFVTYCLDSQDRLSISYEAHSDKTTYINLSNHTYFNLTGWKQSVFQHRLTVKSSAYTCLRQDHIPVAICDSANSPFDFSVPISIQEQIKKYPGHLQLQIGRGYNHGFLLDSYGKTNISKSPALELTDPKTLRSLRVYTDAPCIVLYTSGFMGHTYRMEQGGHTTSSCALAIECQDIPDMPNLMPDSIRLTRANNPFHRQITFAFTKALPPVPSP